MDIFAIIIFISTLLYIYIDINYNIIDKMHLHKMTIYQINLI